MMTPKKKISTAFDPNAARKKNGNGLKRGARPVYTRQMLLDDVRRVARKLGRAPNSREYLRDGKVSMPIFYARFRDELPKGTKRRGMWDEIVRLAGLAPAETYEPAPMLNDLRRVMTLLGGRHPTIREYREHGQYSVPSLYKHLRAEAARKFPGVTRWRSMQRLAAEIPPERKAVTVRRRRPQEPPPSTLKFRVQKPKSL